MIRSHNPPSWIISRPVDLLFIIGSAGSGYLLLLLNVVVGVPAMWLWWVWSVGFDGTHIFATTTRTFFDRESRSADRRLLFGSLGFFFALGPLLVLAGFKGWLALMVGVWAYYHVVRQHFGFLMLYKVKHGDLAPADNAWDGRLLYLMLACPPFYRFFVHHPEELGLPRDIALSNVAPLFEPLMWVMVALVSGGYLYRQMSLWRSGKTLNFPKLFLLAAVIPLHWVTFASMSWQSAVPTVTIVHNLQYHALVWFYNRRKYGTTASSRKRFGWLPTAVSHSLLTYARIGISFSLLYRVPGYELGRISDMAFGFFCGFGLTHYYLDSKIWQVRYDPGLRQILGLSAPAL